MDLGGFEGIQVQQDSLIFNVRSIEPDSVSKMCMSLLVILLTIRSEICIFCVTTRSVGGKGKMGIGIGNQEYRYR